MNQEQRKDYQHSISAWYKRMARDLPWRHTSDPYRIAVSEVMSQQTQIDRVVVKYHEWLQVFPTIVELAKAEQGAVLRQWKGLGYNSRAIRLHQFAIAVVEQYDGVVPASFDELVALPGIGPYTAGAIMVFAFRVPMSFVDTNIKRIVHRVFVGEEVTGWKKKEREMKELCREVYDDEDSYTYHQGLMDLGATICKASKPRCEECPVNHVCTARTSLEKNEEIFKRRVPYTKSKQRFEDTNRFIRGRIIDHLREYHQATEQEVLEKLRTLKKEAEEERWLQIIASLEKEGLIRREQGKLVL